MEKVFYNNNKEVNLEEVTESPVIPHLYMHQEGTLFYKIQKGRKPLEPKRVLIRLESKDLTSSISEVEKRQLYKKDDSKAPKKKIEEMKFSYRTALKLHEALTSFTWGGFSKVRLINSFSVAQMKLNGKNLYFNPRWVHANSERDIVIKLREFIERKI